MRQLRQLRLSVSATEFRTTTLRDAERLIVPVVAMVGDSVVEPLGSDGPEFVPSEELARAPSAWDYSPLVPDHPAEGRESARTPVIIEGQAFGEMFNTQFSAGKLKTEAWIDTARAEALGGLPQDVVRRLRAGEDVEVSVGAWITAEERPGTHNGQAYGVVWRDIVPDHLALLPAGSVGACSNDMGCGAPRANMEPAKTPEEPTVIVSPTSEIIAHLHALGFHGAEETSTAELEMLLAESIRSTEPAFEGLAAVYPESQRVVYVVSPNDELVWYRRGYEIDGQTVTLADDREQVEPGFVPVAAAGDGDTMSSNATELARKLIGAEATPFDDGDLDTLVALGEDKLAALVCKCDETADPEPVVEPEPAAVEPEPVVEPIEPAPVAASRTPEQWLHEAPIEVQRIVANAQRIEEDERAAIVSAIGERVAHVYDGETLSDMPIERLREVASLIGAQDRGSHEPVNFGARPFPSSRTATHEAPDPWAAGIEQRRAQLAN